MLAELKDTGEVSYETKLYLGEGIPRNVLLRYPNRRLFQKIRNDESFEDIVTFATIKFSDLRYGEKSASESGFYKQIKGTCGTLADAEQLWGKELSYNNINDTNAHWKF